MIYTWRGEVVAKIPLPEPVSVVTETEAEAEEVLKELFGMNTRAVDSASGESVEGTCKLVLEGKPERQVKEDEKQLDLSLPWTHIGS